MAGIALHKVMSPVLRKYVETEVQKQYTICRTSHNIHVQTYPNYLPKYSKHDLNYEVINNNRSVPKIRRKPGENIFSIFIALIYKVVHKITPLMKVNYNAEQEIFKIHSIIKSTNFKSFCSSVRLLQNTVYPMLRQARRA